MSDFELAGYDAPSVPVGPVVPIGRMGGKLVAVHECGSGMAFEAVGSGKKYHEIDGTRFAGFDPEREILFVDGAGNAEAHARSEEANLLLQLLSDPRMESASPLDRFALARRSGSATLIKRELVVCARQMKRLAPDSLKEWYRNALEHIRGAVGETLTSPQDPEELLRPELLYVEDDHVTADQVSASLRAAGFVVHHERDGNRALMAARRLSLDVAVLDSGVPGLPGVEVCRGIRGFGGTRLLPVIMTSAQSSDSLREAAKVAGADDYVVKPFRSSELIRRIEQQLRRHPVPSLPLAS